MSNKVAVANRLALWAQAQRQHNWAPSGGAGVYWQMNNDFMTWSAWRAGDPGNGALPVPGGVWALCCWEMPMYAAANLGHLSRAIANTIVGELIRTNYQSQAAFLERGPWSYLPWLKVRGMGRWAPDSGDLVFFSLGGQALAHVVVSLGGERVVSFGEGPPAPAAGFRVASPTVTTIPALLLLYPGATITYGRPKW